MKWSREAKRSHRSKVQKHKTVKLISSDDVESIRNTGTNLLTGDRVEEQVAQNNMSTCRCCGQKIKKGETRLSFTHDFIGNGSAITASTAFMHVDCEHADLDKIRATTTP